MGSVFSSPAPEDCTDQQAPDFSDQAVSSGLSALPLRPHAEDGSVSSATIAPSEEAPANEPLYPHAHWREGVTLESLKYTHDAAVAGLTSLYNLLTLVHRDGWMQGDIMWELALPPPEGWPGDWNGRVSSGEFTCEAAELARHLPIFRDPKSLEPTEGPYIMADTVLLSRLGGHQEGVVDGPDDPERGYCLVPGRCNLPPHMVRLTRCGNRYGYDVVVDTATGCVLWQKFAGDFPPYIDWESRWLYRVDNAEKDDRMYGSYNAMSIQDFVDTVTECFTKMWWMPNLDGESWEVYECASALELSSYDLRRQQIMAGAGWPNPSWDKERTAEEMNVALENGEIC
jgi:hypothetical protein